MDPAPALDVVFANAPNAMLVIAADGTIAMANPAAATLTGYPVDELVGRDVEDLVPMEARLRHTALRMNAMSAEVARPMDDAQILHLARRDGELVPVEIALAAVGDGRYTAIVRNIADRLNMERRLDMSEEVLLLARERERIARDLHDTVLQRLFGLGLELQALEMGLPSPVAERVGAAVDEIDQVISEIRAAVFTLGSAHRDGSFGQELGTIIAQSSRLLGFTPHVRIDGPVEAVITPDVRTELVASLREALSNVARHAHATAAHVDLEFAEGRLTARVRDNGQGLVAPEAANSGNGLRNLRRRAQMLGGGCAVTSATPSGTQLTWWAPLAT